MVELMFMRAICYHAIGHFKQAVDDYTGCMQWSKGQISDEGRTFQFLSFYQKEMALYTYRRLDKNVTDFCPDSELSALFKVCVHGQQHDGGLMLFLCVVSGI